MQRLEHVAAEEGSLSTAPKRQDAPKNRTANCHREAQVY